MRFYLYSIFYILFSLEVIGQNDHISFIYSNTENIEQFQNELNSRVDSIKNDLRDLSTIEATDETAVSILNLKKELLREGVKAQRIKKLSERLNSDDCITELSEDEREAILLGAIDVDPCDIKNFDKVFNDNQGNDLLNIAEILDYFSGDNEDPLKTLEDEVLEEFLKDRLENSLANQMLLQLDNDSLNKDELVNEVVDGFCARTDIHTLGYQSCSGELRNSLIDHGKSKVADLDLLSRNSDADSPDSIFRSFTSEELNNEQNRLKSNINESLGRAIAAQSALKQMYQAYGEEPSGEWAKNNIAKQKEIIENSYGNYLVEFFDQVVTHPGADYFLSGNSKIALIPLESLEENKYRTREGGGLQPVNDCIPAKYKDISSLDTIEQGPSGNPPFTPRICADVDKNVPGLYEVDTCSGNSCDKKFKNSRDNLRNIFASSAINFRRSVRTNQHVSGRMDDEVKAHLGLALDDDLPEEYKNVNVDEIRIGDLLKEAPDKVGAILAKNGGDAKMLDLICGGLSKLDADRKFNKEVIKQASNVNDAADAIILASTLAAGSGVVAAGVKAAGTLALKKVLKKQGLNATVKLLKKHRKAYARHLAAAVKTNQSGFALLPKSFTNAQIRAQKLADKIKGVSGKVQTRINQLNSQAAKIALIEEPLRALQDGALASKLDRDKFFLDNPTDVLENYQQRQELQTLNERIYSEVRSRGVAAVNTFTVRQNQLLRERVFKSLDKVEVYSEFFDTLEETKIKIATVQERVNATKSFLTHIETYADPNKFFTPYLSHFENYESKQIALVETVPLFGEERANEILSSMSNFRQTIDPYYDDYVENGEAYRAYLVQHGKSESAATLREYTDKLPEGSLKWIATQQVALAGNFERLERFHIHCSEDVKYCAPDVVDGILSDITNILELKPPANLIQSFENRNKDRTL